MVEIEVPEEFCRLTKTQAYRIAGIPKATFYRKYLNGDNKGLTVSVDELGNEFIAFDELKRVFGTKVYDGLKVYIETSQKSGSCTPDSDDSVETFAQVSHKLELQAVRLEGEVEKLRAVLTERERLIREQQDRIEKLETRFERLLEDKNPKPDLSDSIPQPVVIPAGFWNRLRFILSRDK